MKQATDLLDEIHLHVANIGKKIGAEEGRLLALGLDRLRRVDERHGWRLS